MLWYADTLARDYSHPISPHVTPRLLRSAVGAPAVFPTLNASVKAGKIKAQVLDDSLRRTLPIRFELGQLDGKTPAALAGVPQNAYGKLSGANVSTPAMLQLALTAAKKSVVLLKNAHKTLPLSKSALAGKTVCVLGPNANSSKAMEAGYVNQHPRFITTPYAGLRSALSHSTVKLVRSATDCTALSLAALQNWRRGSLQVEGCSTTRCSTYDRAAVASALPSCDVFVPVLGLTAYANPGNHLIPTTQEPGNACGCVPGDGVEGECCDRLDVNLPGAPAFSIARGDVVLKIYGVVAQGHSWSYCSKLPPRHPPTSRAS
eukprot:SAG31_NODE_3116_length_4658_cov_2.625576_5_plen_318_part_00